MKQTSLLTFTSALALTALASTASATDYLVDDFSGNIGTTSSTDTWSAVGYNTGSMSSGLHTYTGYAGSSDTEANFTLEVSATAGVDGGAGLLFSLDAPMTGDSAFAGIGMDYVSITEWTMESVTAADVANLVVEFDFTLSGAYGLSYGVAGEKYYINSSTSNTDGVFQHVTIDFSTYSLEELETIASTINSNGVNGVRLGVTSTITSAEGYIVIDNLEFYTVPEPSAMALIFGLGVLSFVGTRRVRK
jgi:hypothetical protein